MLDRIIRVFNLGATIKDKVVMGLFYTYLFISRRLGGASSVKTPWHVCIRFEGKVYDFYLKYILDVHILREMFVDEHYRMPSDDQVKRVIDFGSNIGGSVVYLAHKFPSATILAIEPYAACLEMLRLNTAQFGDRVQVLPVAACGKEGLISLYENGEHWSASVTHRRGDKEGICVPCESFASIANRFGDEDIDFIKCDIEGAEFELFHPSETRRIKHFVGEVHPSITKKTSTEFIALFPHHSLVREQQVGDHVHVELKRREEGHGA